MDVHPTKNVSIGIDPYPFSNFFQIFLLKWRILWHHMTEHFGGQKRCRKIRHDAEKSNESPNHPPIIGRCLISILLLEDKRIILSDKAILPRKQIIVWTLMHALKLTLPKGASFVALLHLSASCTKDKGKKPEEPEKPKPDHYSVSWFNSPLQVGLQTP
jgi:hypothetical protein